MRPITVTQTGAGTSSPIVVDHHGRPEISLQVNVTGTVNWTVKQTLNDPAVSPVWFDHPDTNMVAQTVGRQGNYAYVPWAVELVVNSGAGTASLTVLQAGEVG
jgi:hypothetical protein